jgi:hypothetical protein
VSDDDLALIPRAVRDKLDRAGIKLHLAEWQQFSRADREWLRDAPCAAADEVARYRDALDRLVRRHTGRPAQRLPSAPH